MQEIAKVWEPGINVNADREKEKTAEIRSTRTRKKSRARTTRVVRRTSPEHILPVVEGEGGTTDRNNTDDNNNVRDLRSASGVEDARHVGGAYSVVVTIHGRAWWNNDVRTPFRSAVERATQRRRFPGDRSARPERLLRGGSTTTRRFPNSSDNRQHAFPVPWLSNTADVAARRSSVRARTAAWC